ncbi:MAG: hypothetical protein FLDDKLPJ_00510 [Phycisphaerae bacterium]|nr:hypothetical protein [Phycisphaerae bacterium]
MVSRFLGAGLGLLAFAVAGIAGIVVGNPIEATLSRSLLALVVFFAIGRLLGGAVELMVEEHVRGRRSAAEGSGDSGRVEAAPASKDAASSKGAGTAASRS